MLLNKARVLKRDRARLSCVTELISVLRANLPYIESVVIDNRRYTYTKPLRCELAPTLLMMEKLKHC